MRVIFVTDTLNSGGAERVISILANYFCTKYNVEIICMDNDTVFYDIDPSVKIVHLIHICNSLFSKLKFLRNYFNKDDIIVPFMEHVYCKVLLSCLGKKVKIIPSERNEPRAMKLKWTVIRRLFMHKIDKFIVQTYKIKDYYPAFFQKKIFVIPNPVEKKQYTTEKWNKKSKIVLAIARTDPQKNYPMMIKSFAELHKTHPQYILEIYGCRDKTTEYAIQLTKLINDLKATDYIHINGRSDNVSQLYSTAYMFVMSSDYEGLSNSLIEALCSGRPVVSTKVSGATDLITDHENGLLVEIGNEKEFTHAMQTLIENPALAQYIANNATQCRENLEKDKVCAEWEKVLIGNDDRYYE